MPIMIEGEEKQKGEKTTQIGFRIPSEIFEAIQELKRRAHPRIPNTEFYVEALRLYAELGFRYGLDEDLHPKCPQHEADKAKKPHPLRRPQSA